MNTVQTPELSSGEARTIMLPTVILQFKTFRHNFPGGVAAITGRLFRCVQIFRQKIRGTDHQHPPTFNASVTRADSRYVAIV